MFPPQDNPNVTERYRRMVAAGIAAVKDGDMETARRLLHKAAQLHPHDALPWLWLAESTDDPAQRREYLESAFAADPTNSAVKRALALLSRKVQQETVLAVGDGVAPAERPSPEEARPVDVFLCPGCGGPQRFDPHTQGLACAHCGTSDPIEARPAADRAEQVLDFVLPTERGHRWAETRPLLRCGRCGAETLLPVGQTAEACPYCGAHQWLETPETRALLDPHVIIPFRIDEAQARQALREWLRSGWTTPDDLPALIQSADLHPAYYPFWTFDGTLEARWVCEVNEGSSKAPRWVRRSGVVYELFDDVLVPGLKEFPAPALEDISPFDLKAALTFQPAYLAGWPALTYNLSMADASLQARREVSRSVRRTLEARINIIQEKRGLRTGALNWSDMTFKYILLPVWRCNFRYKGKTYAMWVNGQTGKAGGERPLDRLKLGAWVGIALVSLALLALLLFYLTR